MAASDSDFIGWIQKHFRLISRFRPTNSVHWTKRKYFKKLDERIVDSSTSLERESKHNKAQRKQTCLKPSTQGPNGQTNIRSDYKDAPLLKNTLCTTLSRLRCLVAESLRASQSWRSYGKPDSLELDLIVKSNSFKQLFLLFLFSKHTHTGTNTHTFIGRHEYSDTQPYIQNLYHILYPIWSFVDASYNS